VKGLLKPRASGMRIEMQAGVPVAAISASVNSAGRGAQAAGLCLGKIAARRTALPRLGALEIDNLVN
jgi:hypothetical protein